MQPYPRSGSGQWSRIRRRSDETIALLQCVKFCSVGSLVMSLPKELSWTGYAGEGKAADFVAFDCMSQGKATGAHAIDGSKTVPKRPQNGPKTAANVPEMSIVRQNGRRVFSIMHPLCGRII